MACSIRVLRASSQQLFASIMLGIATKTDRDQLVIDRLTATFGASRSMADAPSPTTLDMLTVSKKPPSTMC